MREATCFKPQTNGSPADRTTLAYIRSGKYEARYGTRHGCILTVTIGERRLANLKRITEEVGGKARFWFTTIERIKAGDILTDPMW